MIELISAYLGGLTILGYIITCVVIFGLQDSLSAYWYCWQNMGTQQSKPYLGHYFTVWCGLVPTLIAPPLYSLLQGDWTQWLILPMCLGLILVGTAPAYTTKRFTDWHVAGAILAAIGAVGILVFNDYYWVLLGAVGLFGVTTSSRYNFTLQPSALLIFFIDCLSLL